MVAGNFLRNRPQDVYFPLSLLLFLLSWIAPKPNQNIFHRIRLSGQLPINNCQCSLGKIVNGNHLQSGIMPSEEKLPQSREIGFSRAHQLLDYILLRFPQKDVGPQWTACILQPGHPAIPDCRLLCLSAPCYSNFSPLLQIVEIYIGSSSFPIMDGISPFDLQVGNLIPKYSGGFKLIIFRGIKHSGFPAEKVIHFNHRSCLLVF